MGLQVQEQEIVASPMNLAGQPRANEDGASTSSAALLAPDHWPDILHRPFRAIVIGWDRTLAGASADDVAALADTLRTLLRLGVWVVLVTGQDLAPITRLLSGHIPPRDRRHLLICAEHGAVVYGFGGRGGPVRRWRRVPTPSEARALDELAVALGAALTDRIGCETSISSQGSVGRRIVLHLTLDGGRPTSVSDLDRLQVADRQLQRRGLEGGLREVAVLAERYARQVGIPEVRVSVEGTSVVVALLDERDALGWIRRAVLEPQAVTPDAVLIVGAAFGPRAGLPGRDERLRASLEGAVVVSVGAEPNEVPAGLHRLGGGSRCLRALLSEQARRQQELAERRVDGAGGATGWRELRLDTLLQPPSAPEWRLEQPGYIPALEHEVESRLAVGNGFLGVRASLELPTLASHPRTFVAGLFDMLDRDPPIPALVPAPDWMRLKLLTDDQPLAFENGVEVDGGRVLDFRRGLVVSEWRFRRGADHIIRLRTLRFVSLAQRALAGQIVQVTADRLTHVELQALVAPLDGLELERADAQLSLWRTPRLRRRLAVAMDARLDVDGQNPRLPRPYGDQRAVWGWSAAPGHPGTMTRLVTMARADQDDPAPRALAELAQARRLGPLRSLQRHVQAWAERWKVSDVVLEGDTPAQRSLRFAVYHLNSWGNPEDERISIGARGLTGEAYLGHVFWDTEIFLLPFYIFTWPAAARALLMYRYHTLPAAREKAARMGYRGALYAWESADTGEEVTPAYVVGPGGETIHILCGTQEQHISADVAYGVWQYWQATGDDEFFLRAGAEILLETARFWSSRAVLEADGRYHIRGVIGPDEYHETVDDNAYTNGLARWNLARGLEVIELLERRWPRRWAELREQLDLRPEERAHWAKVADRLELRRDPRTGVLEQFAGYFGLEPIDLRAYANRTAPMDVLLGRERIQGSQVIKQADVVMLLALLWEEFSPAAREANFRYYEPRCGHGSSLSPATHALVAARLGDLELAWRYFHQAASIDLDDTMGSAGLGIHSAALGGLWQAVVMGFAGMELCPDGLRFEPRLPPAWQRLQFPVQWRGRLLRVDVQREAGTVTVSLERGQPMRVYIGAVELLLRAGTAATCRFPAADPRREEVSA